MYGRRASQESIMSISNIINIQSRTYNCCSIQKNHINSLSNFHCVKAIIVQTSFWFLFYKNIKKVKAKFKTRFKNRRAFQVRSIDSFCFVFREFMFTFVIFYFRNLLWENTDVKNRSKQNFRHFNMNILFHISKCNFTRNTFFRR